MSQTESGWFNHRRGAFHKSLHGDVRTLESLLPNYITSDDRLPFKIVGYSIPCERHPQRNEDSFLIEPHTGIVAVFDGVGGSAAGEIAAQTAKRATLQGWRGALRQIYGGRNVQRYLEDCAKVEF